MTQVPRQLEAYVPGLGHVCSRCGERYSEAIDPGEGEAYVCPQCLEASRGCCAIGEDELTQAALNDPDAGRVDLKPFDKPTLWRILFASALAIVALAIVFMGKR